ncbi:DUF3261 domain-containing protein, partial [Klebsiella aerogenes]|nr:DUF3261 domain-containing protein [Klebsiella aerogenes]
MRRPSFWRAFALLAALLLAGCSRSQPEPQGRPQAWLEPGTPCPWPPPGTPPNL